MNLKMYTTASELIFEYFLAMGNRIENCFCISFLRNGKYL